MFNELSEAKEILARQIFLFYFAFFNVEVVASAVLSPTTHDNFTITQQFFIFNSTIFVSSSAWIKLRHPQLMNSNSSTLALRLFPTKIPTRLFNRLRFIAKTCFVSTQISNEICKHFCTHVHNFFTHVHRHV